MYNHTTPDYICPICIGLQGIKDERTLIRPTDIVYQDDLVTAFITSFFIGKCPGHIVVVPNEHFENLYDMPAEYGHRIFEVSQKLSIAMKKAYECGGVMTLQNNEPASNQHAFHYHLHLFPRYDGDELHAHMREKQNTTPEERQPYAEKIKNFL